MENWSVRYYNSFSSLCNAIDEVFAGINEGLAGINIFIACSVLYWFLDVKSIGVSTL